MPTYEHLEHYVEGTERRTIRIPKSKASKPNVSGHPPTSSSPPRSDNEGPSSFDPPQEEFSDDYNGRAVATDRAFILFSFVLSLCATLLFLIGFSCASWSKEVDDSHQVIGYLTNGTLITTTGLWRTCRRDDLLSIDSCEYPDYPSWQKGVQAMETLALILIVVLLALCIYRLIHSKPADAIAHMILNFSIATLLMIGLIVWGKYARGSSDFCVYLTMAALILFAAAGFVNIAEYTRNTHVSDEAQPLGAGVYPSHTPPPTTEPPVNSIQQS